MKLLERLVYLLGYLAGLVERWQEEKRQQEAQEARAELDKDYRAWYDAHFGGLPNDADDAEQADKTDTEPR